DPGGHRLAGPGALLRAQGPLLGEGPGRRRGPRRGRDRARPRSRRPARHRPDARRVRADRRDRAPRRRRGRAGGSQRRGRGPAQHLPARHRDRRGVRPPAGTLRRRARGPHLPGLGRRGRRARDGGVLLLARGARAARRRLPHAVPRREDRARLPAEPRPRARRRRPRVRVLTRRTHAERDDRDHQEDHAVPTFEKVNPPDAGEGLTEAEIVQWHVAVGDAVTVNQTIVEIETAKSLVELPSPYTGVVSEILAPEGTTVEVGVPIIVVDTDPAGDAPAAPSAPAATVPDGADAPAAPGAEAAAPAASGSGSVLVGYGTVEPGTARRRRRAAEPAPAAPAATAPP